MTVPQTQWGDMQKKGQGPGWASEANMTYPKCEFDNPGLPKKA